MYSLCLALLQTVQTQEGENESMGSHHSTLQCEMQIVCYLLPGTGPISVDLARIQVYKIGIISPLNRLQKA